MHIRELITFVTCPLNYIAVVTRVNVARIHTNRHARFDFAYCYAELSHLRSAKYRISIARVSSFIGHHRFASDVRLSSLRVIERDFARRGKIFGIRDDGPTQITRYVTRYSDI